MEELAIQAFPYPHVFRGVRRSGPVVDWPAACSACDRQCERATGGELQLCSYGLHYQWVDADLLVAGVVVRDSPGPPTRAQNKQIRAAGNRVVYRDQLERVVSRCRESTDAVAAELRERKNAIVEEYRSSESYKDDAVELLRPDLERTLAQVHDYKQFVQQIIQNIDVILERTYPGRTMEEKLDAAPHEEVAIYWAAYLMDQSLDAALFLQYPERITAAQDRRRVRFHGVVTKYLKIYKHRLAPKRLKVEQYGESFGEIETNARAIGIIPHALIDNAVKYAPPDSTIRLDYREADGRLSFAISSCGPPLREDELQHVFDLFFRGDEARARDSEGTGFGLASAQNVARLLDTPITVRQDSEEGPEDTRLTTFAVTFDLADDSPPRARETRGATRRRAGSRRRDR